MPRISLALTGLALFAFSVAAQQPADFTGTWLMDAARSESAHEAAPIGPVTLVISQTATDLSMETKTGPKDRSAIANEKLAYKLDGSESSTMGKSGVPVVCKSHWEGDHLIVDTARNLQGSTVTTHYILNLDPTGKELTINKSLTVQHGYQDPGANNTGRAKDVFVKSATVRK